MFGLKKLLMLVMLAAIAGTLQGCEETPVDCCKPGALHVDLTGSRAVTLREGQMEGVTVLGSDPSPATPPQPCSTGISLKVNFEKVTANLSCNHCVPQPMCGRRMLRVDMHLGTSVGGWSFNIGDSQSNNGWAGDGFNSDYSAELQGLDQSISAYANVACDSKLHFNLPGTLNGTRHVSVYVSNEHVRLTTDQGLRFSNCSHCLYGLNGQPDFRPDGVNYDVYVAFNRVISGNYRNGYGVCSARLSWVCPWPN